METKVSPTLVGAFVLGLGAVLIAAVLWLASGGAWQQKVTLYHAIEDESVAGLNLNAPVKFNGVDVGKVQRIALDRQNPERVVLTLAIEEGTPVKTDAVAVLKTQGLTGIAYVELSGGTRSAPLLLPRVPGELAVIRTKASLSARLENVLTAVLARLDSTSRHIDAVLSPANQAAFTASLENIAALSHTLAARGPTIDASLASAARLLDQGARAGEQLGPVLARIGQSAQAVEAMASQAGLASTAAGQTLVQVGNEVRHLSTDTVPEFQRLLAELSALSMSLRRLSEQTEHNPSGLLFGRTEAPPGPGETPTGVSRP